jgi:hypothetical protein
MNFINNIIACLSRVNKKTHIHTGPEGVQRYMRGFFVGSGQISDVSDVGGRIPRVGRVLNTRPPEQGCWN